MWQTKTRAWTLTATAVFALSATIALEVEVGVPPNFGGTTAFPFVSPRSTRSQEEGAEFRENGGHLLENAHALRIFYLSCVEHFETKALRDPFTKTVESAVVLYQHESSARSFYHPRLEPDRTKQGLSANLASTMTSAGATLVPDWDSQTRTCDAWFCSNRCFMIPGNFRGLESRTERATTQSSNARAERFFKLLCFGKGMALEDELAQVHGTIRYYRNFTGLLFTDGVKYLGDHANCYWLIDLVGSHQRDLEDIRFQPWELEVVEQFAGVVTMREDDNAPVIVRQNIPYTDFPLQKFSFYCVDSVMMLKSEY
ncbi:MAG: hypothetical protein HY700_11740 [Gemmatimonadetes bacterium]|nr:hypothetical protein [Gemmatimonadota bacterium]